MKGQECLVINPSEVNVAIHICSSFPQRPFQKWAQYVTACGWLEQVPEQAANWGRRITLI